MSNTISYTPIIGAYSSIFEISVGMNFAYAASKPFRETIKNAFLNKLTAMDNWYDRTETEVMSKLTLLSDDDFSNDDKKNLKEKFATALSKIKKNGDKLTAELDKEQDRITIQHKPIYIYTAIFSLFLLFLGGQEVVHNAFPIDGLNSLIYISISIITLFYTLTFFNIALPVSIAVIFIGLAIFMGLFDPIKYQIPLPPKYLLNIALIFAFLPFIFSLLRLIFISIKLQNKYTSEYSTLATELLEIDKYAEQLRNSKDFFNQQKQK